MHMLAYLVVADVLDDVKQVGAGVLSVGVEFELRLSPITSSSPHHRGSLASLLLDGRGGSSVLVHF